jgi:hypothetical protein
MRYGLIFLVFFLFSACSRVEPKPKVTTMESNVTKIENNETSLEKKVESNLSVEEGHVIENVFDDELYFEKDKVTKNKRKIVIKYLKAENWEKKALSKIYKKYKRLWSKKQSKDFRDFLESEKSLTRCAGRDYWENLEFEESEPERDVLHSVLLIKYLNNLHHKRDNEEECAKKELVDVDYILSLLPHEVLINKLLKLEKTRVEEKPKYKKKESR